MPISILDPARERATNAVWTRRFHIALTLLAWVGLAAVGAYLLHLVAGPVTFLIISALLAYILYPAIRAMQRFMPRPLAITAVFVTLVGGLVLLFVAVLASLIRQIGALVAQVQQLLLPEHRQQLQPLLDLMAKLGISPDQLQLSAQQLLGQLQGAALTAGAVVATVIGVAINALLIGTLTVYFLVDGARLFGWLRHKTPLDHRDRIGRYLDTVDGTLGHFVRGAVLLACLMSVIVGVGAYLIGVPFALLLAVIVFVCEFVPVVGSYISGGIGILLAFTQGWRTGLIMIVFTILVQGVLDGQILMPRVIGKEIGLHPVISLLALITGAALFGFLGAVLALPIAGVAQVLISAWWQTWRGRHPEQFPEPADDVAGAERPPPAPPTTVPTRPDDGGQATPPAATAAPAPS